MTEATYLTHCRLVLPDRVVDDASLLIDGDGCLSVGTDCPSVARELDLGGVLVLPGLIDLHCDAIEKEVEPRAGVFFPYDFAIQQADRRNAAAGITTPYHAVSFADAEFGVRNRDLAADLVRQVCDHMGEGVVDHRLHVRYEVTDVGAEKLIHELIEENCVHLLSFMDHTPGQGQYRKTGTYEAYHLNNYERSVSDTEEFLETKRANAEGALERTQGLAWACQARGIPLASHDDDAPDQARSVAELGVKISEFPMNLETAAAFHSAGLSPMFGAPNVVRGQSQGGGMRALDAVEREVISLLCSDYHPATLLPAVMKIAEQPGWTLPRAAALVTVDAAAAAGLTDRGAIETGRRADLVAVSNDARGIPIVERVWVAGENVWTCRGRGG
ncbi:MAG: alpha-D-ribose 1-methylphosphonate 5-triphosphate diphosphatase [Planctomycetes bacterium]|nr:alpha-D-ribose 1-methylphosphonate 5-triphosphate diphosphatase [Planctomycetota bacterium]